MIEAKELMGHPFEAILVLCCEIDSSWGGEGKEDYKKSHQNMSWLI